MKNRNVSHVIVEKHCKVHFEAGLKSAEADRQIGNDRLGRIVPDYWYSMAECTFGKIQVRPAVV